jgi:hypothetical protein
MKPRITAINYGLTSLSLSLSLLLPVHHCYCGCYRFAGVAATGARVGFGGGSLPGQLLPLLLFHRYDCLCGGFSSSEPRSILLSPDPLQASPWFHQAYESLMQPQ